MKFYASISYDGSFFKGIAIQPNQTTIKGCFDEALSKFFAQKVTMQLVSRTDKGVHAMDSRICFEVVTKIPAKKLAQVLNPRLFKMQLNWVQEVCDEFSLQKLSLSKEYMYQISITKSYPFLENYHWNLEDWSFSELELQKTLDLFLGEHDFRNFCKVDQTRNIISFCRNIDSISFELIDCNLKIFIRGNGFLWMMVRYIMYAIVSCLKGLISKEDIQRLLKGETPSKQDLKYLRPAPAEGLYLYRTLDGHELSI
jgi:tRNA pseudouridine38-40 synthase